MNQFIDDIINKNIKIFEKEKQVKMEEVFLFISKKYGLQITDGYGSLRGFLEGEGEIFIPNSYGQEDSWDYESCEFDFIILKKKEVIVVRYKNNEKSVENYLFDVDFDFNDFGGKRAYYLHKDLVRFRTTKDFYDTLKPENKYPKGEKDLSGPHFTIRF